MPLNNVWMVKWSQSKNAANKKPNKTNRFKDSMQQSLYDRAYPCLSLNVTKHHDTPHPPTF